MESAKKVYIDLSKIIGVLSIFILGGYLLEYCIYTLPSFDGAMNLQVPQQLLNTGKYMTTWDGGRLFDNKIQTKAPVLFPIYLLWRIFGISTTAALSVNGAYIVLLVIVIWNLCKLLNIPKLLGYCILTSILVMPQFTAWAWGIYGEIPTITLFLCSIWMLVYFEKSREEQYLIYSAIFFSLAFLNKTVILLALPSFLFIFLYRILIDKDLKVITLQKWIIAFIIPLLIFEVFHFIQMGSCIAYFSGWKIELLDVFNQSGVGSKYADTPNIIKKLWKHAEIFAEQFDLQNGSIILITLITVFVYWIVNFFKNRQHGFSNIITLVMCSYFGWWLLISSTDMAWARRIIAGVILLKIVIWMYGYNMVKVIIKRIQNFIVPIKFVVLIAAFIIYGNGLLNQIDIINRSSRDDMQNLADTIINIKNADEQAVFYGYGWWQSPVLSYMSNSVFYNIENMGDIGNNAYLIVDFYWKNLDEKSLNNVLDTYECELIDKCNDNYIYKLSNKIAGNNIENVVIDYGIFDDWWCEKKCCFHIQSGDDGTININVWYPEYKDKTSKLTVQIDNDVALDYYLSGVQTELILNVSPNSQHYITIDSNFETINKGSDIREISWLLSNVYSK